VTYNPKDRPFSGAGYPSYTALKAREKNSLHEALSRKASQLKNTGFEGTKGIIVCDAGASFLSDAFGGATSFNLRTIIGNFFRKHTSVSFLMIVRTFSIDGSLRKSAIQLSRQIFFNGYLPNDEKNEACLFQILSKAIDTAPRPIRLAINAWQPVSGKYGFLVNSFFGGGSLSSRYIKVSSRTIQALLAGELSQADFQNTYGDFVRIVKEAFQQGRSISTTRIESCDEADDDWLVLEFGEPDPGQHPFIKPSRDNSD
jgi:hypothetical protein